MPLGLTDNTDILQGINQVIVAINNLASNLGGSGGSSSSTTAICGCSIPPDTIIDPPAAPDLGNPSTDPPPDGFDDWSSYNHYKCRVANRIIDDLIATCNKMASIPGIVSGLGAGLLYLVISAAFFAEGPAAVATGILAIGAGSAVGVAVIITALVSIILISIAGLAYFADLATLINTNKEDFVCGLFQSTSVEGARTDLYTRIDDQITGGVEPLEGISDLMNKALQALLGTAVLNNLFTHNPAYDDYIGSVDCTLCGSCELHFDGAGSGDLTFDGEEIEVTSSNYLGRQTIVLNGTPCTCEEGGWRLMIVSIDGYVPHSAGESGDSGSAYFDCDETLHRWYDLEGGIPLGEWFCGYLFQLSSQNDAYTAIIRIEKPC